MTTTFGILGTGMVGRTIAARLFELGNKVKIGTRDVEATNAKTERTRFGGIPFAEWHTDHQLITLGTFAEAAVFGDVVFNCTNGGGALDAVGLAGADNLRGKTVVDVSNPLDFSKGMPATLLPHFANTNSLGEEIQRALPGSNVVKTLNIVNCDVMVNPGKANGESTMFVAGNHDEAKGEVKNILKQFGWNDVLDIGSITSARGMEMILPLWLSLMGTMKTGQFGFKIVR